MKKLGIVLVCLFLALSVGGCATKAKKVEAPAPARYDVDLENQGFLNKLSEVESILANCPEALNNCPDLYNKAQALKAEAYDLWAPCNTKEGWAKLLEAEAAAIEACACQAPMEEAAPIVLNWDHALFDFDKYNIRPDAAEVLDIVAEDLKANPDIKVVIIGNTDSIGSDEYNDQLSIKRALSAEDYLVEKGVSKSQVHSIEGKGKLFPIAPNRIEGRDNPAGRQKNRRVEIIRYTMP